MNSLLEKARKNLETITPLVKDCGSLCAGACCQPNEDNSNGMLLFPGEEKYYAGKNWCRIDSTPQGELLICNGTCPRNERPLACRIFPLIPVISDDGQIKIEMDPRAKGTCPLVKHGIMGLRSDFVAVLKETMEALAENNEQKVFLYKLTEIVKDYEGLRALFFTKQNP